MWTSQNRARYDRSKLRYPSDLTDDEWGLVEPLIRPGKTGGGKRTVMAFQRKKPAAIGIKAPFPTFIEPCLPSKAARPPSGPLWVHEIKHDGYRLMVCRDGSRAWPTAF